MQNLLQMVQNVLERNRAAEKALILGFSGGRDSLCLLHLLHALSAEHLQAVYVHHGLRPEADHEAEWALDICGKLGIPARVVRVDVPLAAETRESVEEAARRLRYEALTRAAREWAAENGCGPEDYLILTAHHREDQAETLLLHLLRGSGLTGLCGMAERQGPILRPLLAASREEINAYISGNHLEYLEDTSNADESLTRNWIRHRLIPLMEQQNPRISRTLARTADLIRQDEAYLHQQAREALRRMTDPEGSLSAEEAAALPRAIRGRVIRLFLDEQGGLRDLGQLHIQQVESLLGMQNGRRVTLPGDRVLVKDQNRIRLLRPWEKDGNVDPASGPEMILPLDGQMHPWGAGAFTAEKVSVVPLCEGKIPNLLYTKWISCDTITGSVTVRTRQPGDFIFAGKGRKSLQDYMVDEHIPLSERDRIPLIACGPHILWIVGRRLSDRCRLNLPRSGETGRQLETDAVRVEYCPCLKEEKS